MMDRYFLERLEGDGPIAHPPEPQSLVQLAGSEAHHLLHVGRARLGQQVTLFDGQGYEYSARIVALGRRDATLEIQARLAVDREAPLHVTLALALPKGDRQTWLVQKAVELGVAAVIPLHTQRSIAQPSASALDRLRRTVIEASKQCGRNRLLHIATPQDWPSLAIHQPDPTTRRLFADPQHGQPLGDPPLGSDVRALFLAVGPEGGWTEHESQSAIAGGWQPVALGPRVLRVETAALALAAWALLPRC